MPSVGRCDLQGARSVSHLQGFTQAKLFFVDPCQVILCKCKIQRTIEQWYIIKFCIGLGKSGTDMLDMIRQVFKYERMSQTAVFKWQKLFKDGKEFLEDDPHVGRPSTL